MYTILNIEILSGDISINIIDEKNFSFDKKGNIYLYKVNKDIFSLKIKSNKSSYYSIYYFQDSISSASYNTNHYLVGGNYLHILEKQYGDTIYLSYISPFDETTYIYNKYLFDKVPIFIGMYASCSINISDKEKTMQNIIEFNGIYFGQSIFNEHSQFLTKYYYIQKLEENNKCNVYISSLIFNNEINDSSDSLIISANQPYLFKFNTSYNVMKYTYPHAENDKDIKIEFNLLNQGNYTIYLFFNDEMSKNKYEISQNDSIIIETKDFENGCNRTDLVCKISFNIESLNQIESILLINISTYGNEQQKKNNNDNEDKNNNNNNNNNNSGGIAIIIIIIFLIVVIIIIIVIFRVIKNKNKNENISNKVNSISFSIGENGIKKIDEDNDNRVKELNLI